MNYLSVCSGIEAATVAWHPLGWRPFAFAEIEKFPSAVLKHHYPSIPNLGDMTKFKDWPDAAVNVLVGGTPCQSFSVAGLRKGMADPRGNLALTYLAIADRYQPEWIVWENVPGVLSSSEGRDFGAFLGGLGELGYSFAYRVLDAQYVRVDGFARAVPQRRRRVFVVGHLGDWRRAAAVLLERESLLWDSAPRRQTGQGFAADVAPSIVSSGRGVERAGDTRGQDPVVAEVASTLNAAFGSKQGLEDQHINSGCPLFVTYATDGQANAAFSSDIALSLCATNEAPYVSHALRAEGFDASEDGTGRGTPLVPIAFAHQQGGNIDLHMAENVGLSLQRSQGQAIAFSAKDYGGDAEAGLAPTLRAGGHSDSHANAGVMPAIAFQPRFARNDRGGPSEIASALTGEAGRTGKGDSAQCVATNWAVRRLTPRECERLQGFPDDYTAIPKAADGPRYKALGNSMAVNVMRWIGQRIQMIVELTRS